MEEAKDQLDSQSSVVDGCKSHLPSTVETNGPGVSSG
jgi:hypothetical protein